jgi:serine/threonine-protein kinase
VFELGLEQDELFICMEYLRGVPATSILKTHKPLNPVDMRISVAIVKQAAAGLQFAHDLKDENGESLGVVHRDVSPGNIFITSGGTAKVLDFGVVKAKDSSHKTKTGALKGKFGYMSPEQIMAEPLDSRSDIFSLGIVLFELLTNRRLFTRESEYGTLKAITETPIPTLESFRPDLPKELGVVLAKALSRDLEHRYTSMRAFSEALTEAMKPYGGIADAAEIGDYIQSKFTFQLGETDTMLQDIRRHSTPAPPPLIVAKNTNGETDPEAKTQILAEGISSPGFTSEPQGESSQTFDGEVSGTTGDSAPHLSARERGGSGAMAWAVGIVGLAAVALLAVLLLQKNDPAPVAAGIVYEGQLSPETDDRDPNRNAAVPDRAPDAQAVLDAGAIAVKPAAKDGGEKKAAKAHRCESKSSAEARNRCYVAAEGRKLTTCLRDHAAEVSGSPEMTLSFDLNARGKVVGVSVSPPQFASTTLGTCVKSVAQKIRFGPQRGEVRFRIPLKINQK